MMPAGLEVADIFRRHGDAYRMVPVFHHNLLDVIAMADIMHALCA